MDTTHEISTFIQLTRTCALQMMSNANYIQRELPSLDVPDELRSRIGSVCDSLIGTKHDVITELFELDELVQAGTPEERLTEKMDRVTRWLAESVQSVHTLVMEVQSLAATDHRYSLLFFLIIESATNIINSWPSQLLDAAELDETPAE